MADRTLASTKVCVRSLKEFSMDGTNDPDWHLASLIINKRIVVFFTVDFSSLLKERLQIVGQRFTDNQSSTARASTA